MCFPGFYVGCFKQVLLCVIIPNSKPVDSLTSLKLIPPETPTTSPNITQFYALMPVKSCGMLTLSGNQAGSLSGAPKSPVVTEFGLAKKFRQRRPFSVPASGRLSTELH